MTKAFRDDAKGHDGQLVRALACKRTSMGLNLHRDGYCIRTLSNKSFAHGCSGPSMLCCMVVCILLNFGRRAIYQIQMWGRPLIMSTNFRPFMTPPPPCQQLSNIDGPP